MRTIRRGWLRWAASLIALQVLVFLVASALTDKPHQSWLVLGTIDELVGVMLIALPDLPSRFVDTFFRRVKAAPTQVRQQLSALVRHTKWWVERSRLEARRWFRGVFRARRDIIITPGPARLTVAGHAPTVTVHGTGSLEERVSRLENDYAHLPGQWTQARESELQGALVYRLPGILLALAGLAMANLSGW